MTAPRWAVLGTANIAARAFLPALRAVGGRAVVVGTRDPDRAGPWAERNQVGRTADYETALAADDVDAVYVAVPNHLHTRWARAAVATGRAVLCEKPLGVDAADTSDLLETVPRDALLWESFVFPFHPQTDLIRRELRRLGRIREIAAEFSFTARDPGGNIRWQAELAGGALRDVGCYCVRLARLLFDSEATGAAARAFVEHGVDADIAGVLDFPADQRLLLSASLRGAFSTFTRVVGTEGELRISNPFHPQPDDSVQLWTEGSRAAEWHADDGTAFEHALAHIHAVLRGETAPRHLAVDDALGNAQALDMIRAAAGL